MSELRKKQQVKHAPKHVLAKRPERAQRLRGCKLVKDKQQVNDEVRYDLAENRSQVNDEVRQELSKEGAQANYELGHELAADKLHPNNLPAHIVAGSECKTDCSPAQLVAENKSQTNCLPAYEEGSQSNDLNANDADSPTDHSAANEAATSESQSSNPALVPNEPTEHKAALYIPKSQLPVERPYLFWEFLPQHPYKVLKKVFTSRTRCDDLKDTLCLWIRDLLSAENQNSYGSENREALKEFYSELFLLIEALYNANGQQGKSRNYKDAQYEPSIFNTIAHKPLAFVRDFCTRYPQVYVRRELWCCLHGAIAQTAYNREECFPEQALDWYERVFALTEAAYLLSEE